MIYPIQTLNPNINAILREIKSADIVGNIQKGLKNEIEFNDSFFGDVAHISDNGQVYLSSAYCQYLWLVIDVSLKKIDYKNIQECCKSQNIDIAEYKKQTEYLLNYKDNFDNTFKMFDSKVDTDAIFEYLKRIVQLLDQNNLTSNLCSEINLAKSLRNECKINTEDFKVINLNGAYEQGTNSAYCYGIAFILLHEMSHFEFGHHGKGKIQDEIDADFTAFWSIYSDLTGQKLFSAIVGMICVLFSFLLIYPTMDTDNVHPNEIERMLYILDNVKFDNYKYRYLVVILLNYWAKENNVTNFPILNEWDDTSIEQIKTFVEKFKKTTY